MMHICNWIMLKAATGDIYSTYSENTHKAEAHMFSVSNYMKLFKLSIFLLHWKNAHFIGISFWSNKKKKMTCLLLLTLTPTKKKKRKKKVWLCFLYYDQNKGRDIVNVHLYHKVTYVYTFLKTSPVFPLYRPPHPLYDNQKLHFVQHMYVIVCFCYTFVYWEVFWVKLFNILHC